MTSGWRRAVRERDQEEMMTALLAVLGIALLVVMVHTVSSPPLPPLPPYPISSVECPYTFDRWREYVLTTDEDEQQDLFEEMMAVSGACLEYEEAHDPEYKKARAEYSRIQAERERRATEGPRGFLTK